MIPEVAFELNGAKIAKVIKRSIQQKHFRGFFFAKLSFEISIIKKDVL